MLSLLMALGAAAPGILSSAPTTTLSLQGLSFFEGVGSAKNAFGSDTTGTKIWDAGRVLSDLLLQQDLSGKRVLECGSGTGVGGLSAAAAGADSVLLTDGSCATLPLISDNIEANGMADRASVTRMHWSDEEEVASVAATGPFDMVVGSDLLYAPEALESLLETLTAVCTPDHTEVLLTYPTRFTEKLFLTMARDEYGFEQLGPEEEVLPSLWSVRLRLQDWGI
jgi:ribosomal protein L11 methylase PrmA